MFASRGAPSFLDLKLLPLDVLKETVAEAMAGRLHWPVRCGEGRTT